MNKINMLTSPVGGGNDNNLCSSNPKKILTRLQSLRALAFLGVCISHTGFYGTVSSLGAWGVSIFFVLSGFVMVYSYYNKGRIQKVSIIDNLKFAYSRLKKLYLLHIVCTLSMALFLFVGDKTEPILESIGKIVANIIFIQEYLPLQARSINGVAWFVCPLVLGYFIFPFVIRAFENNYSRQKAYISIFAAFLIEFLIALTFSDYVFEPRPIDPESLLVTDIPGWIVYYFPLTRIWDIVIGFNLCYLFITRENDISTSKANNLELIGWILVVISNYCYFCLRHIPSIGDEITYTSPEQWWTKAIVFLPSTIILIYAFAYEKGFISKILTNKVTMYLANISAYGFLIHYVVFRYLVVIYFRIPGFQEGEFAQTYGSLINLTVGMIVTLICVEIWKKIYSFLQKRKIRFTSV